MAQESLIANADLKLEDFSRSVNQLAHCYPLVKPRILKGLVACIQYDHEITPVERETITSIAAAMDCPLPDLELDLE